MRPILLQWGELTIGSYAALMSLGLIAAIGIAAIEARRLNIRSLLWLDAALAAITIGVIGARLGYAAINWAYFKDHLGEIMQLWEGGLLWPAGLIGGSIGAWLLARRAPDRSPMRVLDRLATGAPLGIALAWIGCYLAAVAYGKELYPVDPFFFAAIDVPDVYGVTNPRWPTQWLGVAWAVIVFALLWSTRRAAWPNGTRYWLFVAAYCCGSFLIDFTRGDDVPRLIGWRIDQVLDGSLFIIGVISLIVLRAQGFGRIDRSPEPLAEASPSNRT
jgi:phosphatidylglycerol:prolipoprotein diacylglycerol transferase